MSVISSLSLRERAEGEGLRPAPTQSRQGSRRLWNKAPHPNPLPGGEGIREDSMQPTRHIQRFPWGTADDAQVLIVHFGSKSTPMIAQLLRHIGLRSRVIDAADVPAVTASGYHPKLVILSGGDDSVFNENAPTIAERDLAT